MDSPPGRLQGSPSCWCKEHSGAIRKAARYGKGETGVTYGGRDHSRGTYVSSTEQRLLQPHRSHGSRAESRQMLILGRQLRRPALRSSKREVCLENPRKRDDAARHEIINAELVTRVFAGQDARARGTKQGKTNGMCHDPARF